MENLIQIPYAQKPVKEQIIETINGYTMEVCLSEESKATAYHLRYKAYINTFPELTNDDEILCDLFDDLPNCRIHLIWFENKPVATVRSCIWSEQYSWAPIEAFQYFGNQIDNILGSNVCLLESSRYAIDPEFQGRKSLFAQLLCFRIHALNSSLHECSHIITLVRAKHVPFYQRFLGLSPLSEDEKAISWLDASTVLLGANREESLERALSCGMPSFEPRSVERYNVAAAINSIKLNQ